MSDNEFDDFRVFDGVEDGSFGPFERHDLFRLIRRSTEDGLRRQVSDSVLQRIETFGSPMFLSFARETADPWKVVLGHFAFAFRAHLSVSFAAGTRYERVDAALTFFFGNVDVPGAVVCNTHVDLHHEAALNFTEACFKKRVLIFRAEVPDPPVPH